MDRIGMVTVGQSPRDDLAVILARSIRARVIDELLAAGRVPATA